MRCDLDDAIYGLMTTNPLSAPQLGATLDFMRLLWSLAHELHSMSKRTKSRLGVTGPQRLALRVVGRQAKMSAGTLAEVLHLHPSTLTGILRRLIEGGLLARVEDPSDARRIRLSLTKAGKRLDRTSAHTVEAAVTRALRKTPTSDLAAATRVINTVISELERG